MPHRISKRAAELACLLFALLLTSSSSATLVLPLTVTELSNQSTVIVTGTIGEQHSAWTDDGFAIVTSQTLSVTDVLKGPYRPGDDVTFMTLGGVVGDLAQSIAGEAVFQPGETVLVFLEPRPGGHLGVVGMSQGKFLVDLSAEQPTALQDLGDLSFAVVETRLDPSTGDTVREVTGAAHPSAPEPIPLSSLIDTIRAANAE